jgi:hypothetical protein
MLTIIICSVNQDYLNRLKENINQTIGIPYEILVRDNRKDPHSICRVYNTLAQQSSFTNLLFLHEDVSFQTKYWGDALVKLLNEHQANGVVGLAGSAYKSANYSGWYTGIEEMDAFNIVHDNKGELKSIRDGFHGNQIVVPVKVLDGVFLACRKDVWQEIQFNENLLTGFHFYDIDFSLRASAKYSNFVIRNLDLVHFTIGGDFGEPWINTAFLFHRHFKSALQSSKPEQSVLSNRIVFKSWLNLLKNEKIKFRNRVKWLVDQFGYIHPSNIYSVIRFMLYRPLGLNYIHGLIKRK